MLLENNFNEKMVLQVFDTIKNTIDKFETRHIFTANDFPIAVEKPKNVSKILDELVCSQVVEGQILQTQNL